MVSPLRASCFLCLISFLVACGKEESAAPTTELPPTAGLFQPIDLGMDTTTLYLRDFFPHGERPDSFFVPDGLHLEVDDVHQTMRLTRSQDSLAWLSNLGFRFGTHRLDVLLRRSRKEKVLLKLDPKGQAWKEVQVAGELNNWNPSSSTMALVNGVWQKEFILNPGAYQYQFVTDGKWGLDPGNPVVVANGIGGFNSEIVVGSAEARATPAQVLSTYDNHQQNLRVWLHGVKKFKPEDLFVFHDNKRIEVLQADATEGGCLARIEIPAEAARLERSYLRVWLRSQGGWSNDLLIPLKQRAVVSTSKDLGPGDQHANILYFMMVDRFANGDTTNDAPLADPEVHFKANYHGGDLAGITSKLKSGYFDSLGVNMLWLSPIVQNPDSAFREWPAPHRKYSGYHGYWPVVTNKVDHRFGSSTDLDTLVATAHRQHNKVILDYVANHLHQDHPILQAHPDWITQLKINDSTLNIRLWDSHRLSTWFDTFLPSLDHSKPEVIDWQADTAVWWISRFKLDGFRHDATKHIEEAFWRRLTERLRTDTSNHHNRPLFQIGETFGSRELIGSYVGPGLLDGQFDFNHYFDIRSAFAQDGQSIEDNVVSSFRESEAYYGSHSLMGYITGNHDMGRFISYASGALRFNEDPKLAGWTREITVLNPIGYARLRMLIAYLSAIPGLPVIYYGDEIGMPGADDPDNRRDMRFSGLNAEEAKTKEMCSALLKLRGTHMATLYGETAITVEDRVLKVHRHYFDDDVFYLFNVGPLPATTKVPIYGIKHLVGNGALVENKVQLPAWGFEVMGRN
jgi:cyclomaltodextrinase